MSTAPSEPFRLFVDVDLPSDGESYKVFRRRSDKGSIYLTDERANVQVWMTGSPSTLRLLAQHLEALAEDVELKTSTLGSE